ncbi:MAG: hypothetical protein RLZZ303_2584, partial [Candidatus Hydrogenedentota bacterium]
QQGAESIPVEYVTCNKHASLFSTLLELVGMLITPLS